MKKIKIYLVENNKLLLDGTKSFLNKQPDLKVVAAAIGTRDIVLRAQKLKPDVVLMDVGLRSESDLRVVKDLTEQLPHINVIGLGLVPSQQDIMEFVQAGAAGFILKTATLNEVLETIRSVARGIKILPPLLMGTLFTYIADHTSARRVGKIPNAVRMTTREREIILLIGEGRSNKDIAERVNLSTYTVKSHVHNILEKLALHSRLGIAAYSHDNRE